MHVRILAICQKTPSWVEQGYQDYLKRFPPAMRVETINLLPEKRVTRYVREEVIAKESARLLEAHQPKNHLIVLDSKGESWSSEQVAEQFLIWTRINPHVDFLIGGADGLSAACLQQAKQCWSLSKLTFPHTLIKLLLIEQLYRAWSIVHEHPYHR